MHVLINFFTLRPTFTFVGLRVVWYIYLLNVVVQTYASISGISQLLAQRGISIEAWLPNSLPLVLGLVAQLVIVRLLLEVAAIIIASRVDEERRRLRPQAVPAVALVVAPASGLTNILVKHEFLGRLVGCGRWPDYRIIIRGSMRLGAWQWLVHLPARRSLHFSYRPDGWWRLERLPVLTPSSFTRGHQLTQRLRAFRSTRPAARQRSIVS